jgi:protein DGCR14
MAPLVRLLLQSYHVDYKDRPASPQPAVVGNYPLLPVDASPSPAELPDLLTWGTLMATPRALGGSGEAVEGGRSFRLPETQRRDQLGRKLADDASRSMRLRAQGYTVPSSSGAVRKTNARSKNSGMLPPATPRRNASNLTPAARKLLERSARTPSSSSQSYDPKSKMASERAVARSRGW